MKLYLAGDTGPSGFGEATRGFLKQLIHSDIDVTCKTHQWGISREGFVYSSGSFPDIEFSEDLLKDNVINEEYLLEDPRELSERTSDVLSNLSCGRDVNSEHCIVKQFDGKEDVWMAFGGANFTEQAPNYPYTIVSTDFNLDIVPRDWEYYINQVDELWVPSEWNRDAVLKRVGDEYSDKVFSFPYGIEMDYRPTEYDCEVCPHNSQQSRGPPDRCLRDGSFNFMVLSRFYHIKGIYRSIKAFIEEFRQGDDVRMFIKTTSNNQFQFNPVQSAQAIVDELGYPDPPEIGFAVEPMNIQYLYDLFGHCDAFLQFSRAECFGIAQLQAAYCGTPVAYTNWSSQGELLDEDNDGFFPLDDYELQKPAQEFRGLPYEVGADYPPDSNWAVPSIEAIRNIMRDLYERDDLNERGKDASGYVKDNFQWDDMASPGIERIREIA